MSLSREDVRHVARLARLGLNPEEEEYYAAQLNAILGHIDRLSEADTEAIPPTAQAVPLELRLRPDVIEPGLTQAEALSNAPASREEMFLVSAIQEPAP
ncbi:MAG: Asp-tRNA(Asn)/Glu-tRNA(Gln) amidotransferase subunit GatC [Candidatus Dormibacteraceae bacterium]